MRRLEWNEDERIKWDYLHGLLLRGVPVYLRRVEAMAFSLWLIQHKCPCEWVYDWHNDLWIVYRLKPERERALLLH